MCCKFQKEQGHVLQIPKRTRACVANYKKNKGMCSKLQKEQGRVLQITKRTRACVANYKTELCFVIKPDY